MSKFKIDEIENHFGSVDNFLDEMIKQNDEANVVYSHPRGNGKSYIHSLISLLQWSEMLDIDEVEGNSKLVAEMIKLHSKVIKNAMGVKGEGKGADYSKVWLDELNNRG